MQMAHLRGESSNSLFEVLEEWERHLQAIENSPNTVTQDNDPRCGYEQSSE